MARNQIVKKVRAAASGTATDSFSTADIPVGYGLAGIKPSGTLTSVNAYVEMSSDNSTFTGISDEQDVQLVVVMASARYKRLMPAEYPVLDEFMRLSFASGISAAREFELFFRPVA